MWRSEIRRLPSGRFARFGIGCYVVVWVFEGAIRKWVPGLNQPFYVVRDLLLVVMLVACLLIVRAVPKPRILGELGFIWAAGLTLLVGLQIMGGITSLSIAIVGLRNYLAPLLLATLVWIGSARLAWRQIPRLIAYTAPIEVILTLIQVVSPKTAWINIEPTGDSAYFVTAGEIVRASGSFSAPAGLSSYSVMCLAVGLIGVSCPGVLSRFWTTAALGCGVIISATGGSRGAVFLGLLVVAVWACRQFASMHPAVLVKIIAVALGLLVLVAFASWLVPQVLDAFLQRFQNASQAEDTTARVWEAFSNFLWTPLTPLGSGAGANSSIGISLGSELDWIEVDTVRWVAELGYFGLISAAVRVGAGVTYLVYVVIALARRDQYEVVFAAVLIPLLVAGSITTNPTTQGAFAIIIACLLSRSIWIRSTRNEESNP